VLFFPFFVWSPSWRLRILAGSLVALVVMLTFSIGVGIPALWFDTVVRHIWEPTHYDGLTVGATVFVAGWGAMPSWVFPAAVVAGCVVILRRKPRDTADLCVAAAFLFLVSTVFASYARFNFYYVVAATLLLALASFGVDPEGVGLGSRSPDNSKAALATIAQ
jgi:energy-converting hydrogenase Eha subunit A